MDYDRLKKSIGEKLSIVDVVSSYTKLQRAGSRLKAKSPFTNEKTPSFFVDEERGFFYCFSSNKGGDMITFVKEIENCDFNEAMSILASKAGLDIEDFKTNNPSYSENRKKIIDELNTVKDIYVSKMNKDIKDVYLQRGLKEETIDKWKLGYAPNEYNFLCDSKSPEKIRVEAGLCASSEKGFYDRFKGRLMFPFFNENGETIGFSGRQADSNSKVAKYINCSNTEVFNKSNYLFGLYFAKKYIRKNNIAIVVEGPFDVILSHQDGVPFAVAPSGTSITIDHLKKLKTLTENIVLAFDGDEAGIKAIVRASSLAFSLGFNIKVPIIEKGEDPASLVQKNLWKNTIKNSISVIDFLLDNFTKEVKEDDIVKTIKNNIFPIIANIEDSMTLETVLSKIANHCKISFDATKNSFEEYKEKYHKTSDEVYYKNNYKDKDIKIDVDEKMLSNGIEYISNSYFFLINQIELPKKIDDMKKEIEEIIGKKFENKKDYAEFKRDIISSNDVGIENTVNKELSFLENEMRKLLKLLLKKQLLEENRLANNPEKCNNINTRLRELNKK